MLNEKCIQLHATFVCVCYMDSERNKIKIAFRKLCFYKINGVCGGESLGRYDEPNMLQRYEMDKVDQTYPEMASGQVLKMVDSIRT